ncbi:DUF1156 domain-containing protein [Anaeromyxobacter sp. Fw109-5]|uniref:DUF1156 domain-containing protein n=1 Tax=Anaeromyxobacter sp. (strain Fw109-5) TaxID=404589 RepID=UPI000158A82B|nr:DUF1156 domain-containing protein [Anaeromyxobacter sp. Fw109-5]ABS28166.1 protein of unknown function DUF1156 [Anaeromyxobacter sp. Fw109-5]
MVNGHQPRRLIEVDLPIRVISQHARHEKSIRHGHLSTLHIWWARRPLAACRAVALAALLPDPADEYCPKEFREEAAAALSCLRDAVGGPRVDWNSETELRKALLRFVGDIAAHENASSGPVLDAARRMVLSAQLSLHPGRTDRPLIVDPFAGGGAIPVEALRLGADVFASDLNPIAVLLNRLSAELLPKFGAQLADELERCGEWVASRAEQELRRFYPAGSDGSAPIAYLWARTIRCEGPGCGVELPLIRSTVIARKSGRSMFLKLRVVKSANRIDFAIEEGTPSAAEALGTIKRGSATCPLCGFTTANARLRAQLSERRGGAADARLLAVVSTKRGEQGRKYRLPTTKDVEAFAQAQNELRKRQSSFEGAIPLVPDELVPAERPSPNARGLSAVTRMGVRTFGDLFTPRQLLAHTTFVRLCREAGADIGSPEMRKAVRLCLALSLSKATDLGNSCTRWKPDAECPVNLFARQAIPIVWDFAETVSLSDASGSWRSMFERTAYALRQCSFEAPGKATVQSASAAEHPLPDDAAAALVTDPPYYDAVPYADLSDFFYVWLRRVLFDDAPDLFSSRTTPKDEEAIWNPTRKYGPTGRQKDQAFYEEQMYRCLAEARRVTAPDGIGVVVFAHKSTEGWEAILGSLIRAGWVATASWPIDTEMGSRVNAMGTASLASSVHIVCRPRGVDQAHVGEWKVVLAELPERIHQWLPRLAHEGVVGADAIFACLGPALEIFSRYSRVEKVNGEAVPLREYLEHVWAAVAREALASIFRDADTAGLEADARLTAMWLWTLAGPEPSGDSGDEQDQVPDEDEDDDQGDRGGSGGAVLPFDTARKIAQGLGVRFDELQQVVEIKKDKARLIAVAERAKYLFGRHEGVPAGKKAAAKKQAVLFTDLERPAGEEAWGEGGAPKAGTTTLDRVHQAMLLFGGGRSDALKRFLVEDRIGMQAQFWKLAQSLSALYPSGSDEKRWVDGVLARKKGLGFG